MKALNSLIAHTLPFVPKPVVGVFAKNYIAGETLEKACEKCQELNGQRAMATMDYLGESVRNNKQVEGNVAIYWRALEEIKKHQLDSNISVKPTSFGAVIDRELCFENLRKTVAHAKEHNNFVRIDMEDHPYTDFTIESYNRLREEFPRNVGTVLQSYLRRTYDDADKLSQGDHPTNLRLCKGIYNESVKIAYKNHQKINDNFLRVLDLLFSRSVYVGIATHDEKLVKGALELIEKYQLAPDQYEFQMLLGVRESMRDEIIAQGHRLRIYIPFGQDWFAYSTRRFKENPDIVGSVIKGFFKK